ncbi:MAG: hypothetical protein J1E62_12110, partial [Lachnospiraceae bacterium]|nr:hypothetical protein [Lachnospiraceae bacterium]
MKRIRKICTWVMIIALLCGLFPAAPTMAAKKKAKKVTLSSKKLTITKGKSKTLKVKNAKK